MEHYKLANSVIEMLLSGNDPIFDLLKKQYQSAKIIKEEASSVGFYIDYDTSTAEQLSSNYKCSFQFGDVDGDIGEVKNAVGFILYIRNGYLSTLEGYTNTIDVWPDNDSNISLHYEAKGGRNYETLKRKCLSISTKNEPQR